MPKIFYYILQGKCEVHSVSSVLLCQSLTQAVSWVFLFSSSRQFEMVLNGMIFSDAMTVIGFLKHFGLDKDFKVGLYL